MKESYLFKCDQQFKLESGETLPCIDLKYTTYGTLNKNKDNIVWVCHALTGGSDFTEWWPSLFGEGKVLDPKKYFLVCANILGSCYGSTGPLSINPNTRKPYYHSFPAICSKDIILAFELLRNHLEISQIHCIIGGSLGGQHAIEWIIEKPDLFKNAVMIASNAVQSPWAIAFNESQRMAIEMDPTWQLNSPRAGVEGMKVARAVAMLSYRHYDGFKLTQSEENDKIRDNFKAATYQVYQGEKLAKRFNAFTYYVFSKMMDAHNVGRGRGGVRNALKKVKAKTLVVGIDTDILFPVEEQKFMTDHMPNAELVIINSKFGHDGFLIDLEKINKVLTRFLSLAT